MASAIVNARLNPDLAEPYRPLIDNRPIVVFFLGWIAAFIVLLIWMNKAHKATQSLWAGARRWTSGWTVGGWFIPVAQFFIPKMVLNEVERIAAAPRSGGWVADHWLRQKLSALGSASWILLAVGLLLNRFGAVVASEATLSQDEIRMSYILQGAGLLGVAASCGFGAMYVRRIGCRLSPAGLSASP